MTNAIDPAHYQSHPTGLQCIQITEHMNFCRGNAMKYIWRCGLKGDPIEDLRKARWYLDREIARMMGGTGDDVPEPAPLYPSTPDI